MIDLYQHLNLCLRLLCCIGFVSIVALEDNYEQIYRQVFLTNDGNSDGIDGTLHLLKRLNNLNPKSNEKQFDQWAEVNEFIWASELKLSKCNVETFQQFDLLLRNYEKSTFNLVPYLKHWRAQQFDLCKNYFVAILNSHVNLISKTILLDMDILRNIMFEVGENRRIFLHLHSNQLEEGFRRFIELKARENLTHTRSNKFDEPLKRLNRVCKWILSKEVTSCNFRDILAYDEMFVEQVDSFTLDWLTNVKICSDVMKNFNQLSNMVIGSS